MDFGEIKQQILEEVIESLNITLRDIEPQVIDNIFAAVKNQYDQILYKQENEISSLSKRVHDLEETISWMAHNMNLKI